MPEEAQGAGGLENKSVLLPGWETDDWVRTYWTGRETWDVITEYWAEHLLKSDLYDVEKQVESLGHWNQPQFDALVSFAYNIGFYKLKTSTLMKKIQEGANMRAIKKEFMRWVYAGGKKQPGLERRRAWEAKRFFEEDLMEPMKVRDWSDFHKTK